MAGLHDTHSAFADSNMPLYLLLGLLSWSGRVVACLPAPTEPTPAEAPNDSADRDGQTEVDALLACVLGIVSFRQSLECEATAAAAPARANSDEKPNRTSVRGLLR